MAGAQRAIVAWGLLGVLVLGSCSGDDDESATPDEAEPTAAADPADVDAAASTGCGTSAVAAGEEKVTLQSAGAERWYFRSVPAAHDGQEPLPLIVDLHGYSEGAEVHKALSLLGDLGETEGFVTVTPQGLGQVPFWDTNPEGPDVAFFGEILDDVESTLCVDTNRIYVTGFSNGAMLTSVVACSYGDRIAAVAPVAGAGNVEGCDPGRPVPAIGFHGTADPILDFDNGGFGAGVADLPTPDGSGSLSDLNPEQSAQMDDIASILELPPTEVMAAWAERNGCEGTEPSESSLADDVTVLTFDCPADAAVEFYRIEGGGHTWPGSHLLENVAFVGPTTFSINANDEMWTFFQSHPLTP